MEKSSRVEWLDLPIELWRKIAKHLTIDNTSFDDVFRFRSVCKTWCSAHPLPQHTPFPPQLCIPLTSLKSYLLLQTTTIYRLQPLLHDNQDPSISSSSSKGWLIMLGDSQSAPLRLLNPFTNTPVVVSNYTPQVLNFMNFKVLKVVEAFNFSGEFSTFVKLVLFPPNFPVEEGRSMVCVLYESVFCVYKIGDNNWTKSSNGWYHDIIIHKGQVYVIDYLGTIFWMNPLSMELVLFTQRLSLLSSWDNYRNKRQMVECGGILYVVEIVEMDRNQQEEIDVKVYNVDEDFGRMKVVKNLGDDVVFVLGKDCNFSLSAKDYHGIQGNCIYFSYKVDELHKIFCCFSLKDEMLKTSPHAFWPCPTLFNN